VEVIGVGEERWVTRVRLQADELDVGGARVGKFGKPLFIDETADATAGGFIDELHGSEAGHGNVAKSRRSIGSARAHLVIAIAIKPEPDLREILEIVAQDARGGETDADPVS